MAESAPFVLLCFGLFRFGSFCFGWFWVVGLRSAVGSFLLVWCPARRLGLPPRLCCLPLVGFFLCLCLFCRSFWWSALVLFARLGALGSPGAASPLGCSACCAACLPAVACRFPRGLLVGLPWLGLLFGSGASGAACCVCWCVVAFAGSRVRSALPRWGCCCPAPCSLPSHTQYISLAVLGPADGFFCYLSLC